MNEADLQVLRRKIHASKQARLQELQNDFAIDTQQLQINRIERQTELWRRQNADMLKDTIAAYKHQERQSVAYNLKIQRERYMARARSLGLGQLQIDEIFRETPEQADLGVLP